MFWIRTAVTLLAGIVALVVVILSKRPVDIGTLGSVSDQWIADHHRVDSV
jgi:uncharacterized membrane protein YidH (DUF202 family)